MKPQCAMGPTHRIDQSCLGGRLLRWACQCPRIWPHHTDAALTNEIAGDPRRDGDRPGPAAARGEQYSARQLRRVPVRGGCTAEVNVVAVATRRGRIDFVCGDRRVSLEQIRRTRSSPHRVAAIFYGTRLEPAAPFCATRGRIRSYLLINPITPSPSMVAR